MTTLKMDTLTLPMAPLEGESSLPPIAGLENPQQRTKAYLDEDDELFIGYGFVKNSFPYRMQDRYSESMQVSQLPCAVLENEYLRAEFLPTLGGRLWSLFDKQKGQELLYRNPVLRPRNLAARNAWFSGGVEWNCGVVGHSPYTCSPLFTAQTQLEDGTPVLRMYEFERIRQAVYQMDFFLPEGSKLLLARMRIVNPNQDTIPMYWWSNIAVPEQEDCRVVVPASFAYCNGGSCIRKESVPMSHGIDITYPTHLPNSIEYVWRLNEGARRYICQQNAAGYGLVQTSTRRLKGRKLFAWGQSAGGKRWQRFMSNGSNDEKYAELQAGLAYTQYECIPMPPNTAWEWMEAYGALQADASKVHGDYAEAAESVEAALNDILPQEALEHMLKATHAMAIHPAEQLLQAGGGWGALENLRRQYVGEEAMCPHLNFGPLTAEQEPWKQLLLTGAFPPASPSDAPSSWMLQAQWTALLERAVTQTDRFHWYAWLQVGMTYFQQGRLQLAREALERSMLLEKSCWALYGLAFLAKAEGEIQTAAALAVQAATLCPEELALAKQAMNLLVEAKRYSQAIDFATALPAEAAKQPRVLLALATAYLGLGQTAEAEQILYANDGLTVPDIRECENTLTELWFQLEEAKALAENRAFDRQSTKPPENFDFRMFV
ncbi:MAG: DUF5107 domain-containing protein [Clostridia bacterium]